MKRFLYATDFSKASENSFLYTKNLVLGKNIKVDIINVYELPISYSTQTPSRAVQGYLAELKAASIKRMNALKDQLPVENQGEIHSIYGIYPSSEIEECAEEIQADMIIMSLRQDYGILRRLIGNTTAKTIHKSKVPVMAIPANAFYSRIQNILFPTAISVNKKLSSKDIEAIKWLSILSGFLNAPQIELIHIIDDTDTTSKDVTIDNPYLDNLKITYSHAFTVEEGIYDYMEKKSPDLLAFYKPHRTFWERLYRPSKTRQLLYDSNTPVLVFG